MRGKNTWWVLLAIGILTLVCPLSATASETKGAPEVVACDARIEWQVAPEARITSFECALGNHKGKPALIFKAGVQNVTDRALRYRLNIFLMDMDKAAGHLIPRKGKPPALKPGAAQTVKVPFILTTEMSKEIMVVVKPLGK